MSIDQATVEEWYKVVQPVVPPVEPLTIHKESTNTATLADYIKSKQVGGNHYKGSIEPWEAMLAWGLDPWACNVLKYVQRHRKKNGKEDLEKALHYLEFMISNYDALGAKYYK